MTPVTSRLPASPGTESAIQKLGARSTEGRGLQKAIRTTGRPRPRTLFVLGLRSWVLTSDVASYLDLSLGGVPFPLSRYLSCVLAEAARQSTAEPGVRRQCGQYGRHKRIRRSCLANNCTLFVQPGRRLFIDPIEPSRLQDVHHRSRTKKFHYSQAIQDQIRVAFEVPPVGV
jgi:hypothetical protein